MRPRGLGSDEGDGVLKWAALVAVIFLLFAPSASARRRHHGYAAWFVRAAACIRYHESRGDWHINTGNGYYGAYQFLPGTWQFHVEHPHPLRGWPVRADLASPAQQTFIVWRTYIWDGRSFREWGTAGGCGLS